MIRGLASCILSAAVLITAGCRVDQQEFDNRVFACDVAAPDPGCGVDQAGREMGCFPAEQLGASAFCARTCDPQAPATSEEVCLSSKISLRSCHPSVDPVDPGAPRKACAQKELACYRSDLLSDEGVCTTMSTCDVDEECRGTIRSVCATSFLANLYAGAGDVLQNDHMYCLQTGCRARGTACSPGETCLQQVIAPSAHPPDICVPDCDSHGQCPPNFFCYRKVSTPATPNVCIPGLLGFTCESDIDCMLGKCINNGIGYKVCTTTCRDQADCQRFDGEQGKFICIKNEALPDSPGVCQTPDSYTGSLCTKTDQCLPRDPDTLCSRFDAKDAIGTCLRPCPADGVCEPRVGINHTCVPSSVDGRQTNVCFPGYFGLPCAVNSNCLPDLKCQALARGGPSICSQACEVLDDCLANRWIGADGWCDQALGQCRSKLQEGAPCTSSEMCKSGRCPAGTCGPQGTTP